MDVRRERGVVGEYAAEGGSKKKIWCRLSGGSIKTAKFEWERGEYLNLSIHRNSIAI